MSGQREGRSWLVTAAYAAPAFAFAMPTLPVYLYLPPLNGDTLGLGLALTGWILLAARLFDTFTDPLVGYLSDRSAIRFGRRKTWVVAGAPVAALGFFMVTLPPAEPGPGYLLFWMLILYGGWTAVMVPYLAWAAELSRDYAGRTLLTATREGAGLAGILFAAAIPALISGPGPGNEQAGLAAVTWSTLALGGVFVLALAYLVPDPPGRASHAAAADFTLRQLSSIARNRPFLRLAAAWFINGLANGVAAVLFLIYLEHGLGVGAEGRPVFVLAYFFCAIAATPLWHQLSARHDKHRVWCAAMAVAVAGFIFVPFIGTGQEAAFLAVCVVTGLTLGADLALPPSLQADVVDYDHLKHGTDRAGLFFALWSMATKLALGVAAALALGSVSALGFDPDAPDGAGRTALVLVYALVPMLLKSVAIALVWNHPITRRRHDTIRRAIDRRRSSSPTAA